MNIDFSVLFWTIVCFLALILILDRLLFRPILRIIARRQEKIDAGIEAGRAATAALEEQALKSRTAQELRHAEEVTRTEQVLRTLRTEDLDVITSTKQALDAAFQSLEEQLSKKAASLDAALDAETTRLSRMLANRLIAEDGSNETAIWYN